MRKVLDGLISRNFEDIRGTRVVGSIPVTEALLDKAARQQISQTRGRIQEFDIQIGKDNFLEVGMKVAVGPFSKWFRPEVKIETQAQPALILFTLASREYAGVMWLAELFAKELLPKGFVLRGRQLILDLSAMTELSTHGRLTQHIKALDVTTTRGAMTIAFELRID